MEGETSVFKVFLPDRVLQRSLSLRNAVLSGLWSRSWILVCLVAAFKIFAQSRVLQRLLRVLVNTLVKGVFGLFPEFKKSPKVSPHSGSELSADFNPSTLGAHQMAPPDEWPCVGAFGHCAGLVLAELGHWASTVAPALGALRCLRSSS